MIDFAHVRMYRARRPAPDEGYLHGLRTLLGILESLHAPAVPKPLVVLAGLVGEEGGRSDPSLVAVGQLEEEEVSSID